MSVSRSAVRSSMLVAAVVLASPALAPAAPDPLEHEAQIRFEEGLRRVKAGDLGAARVSFAQAYAVLHRTNILWNLALCEEKTGHPVDALEHFRQVARDASATDADRAEARRHIEALLRQTGHVEVQAPAGVALAVDSGPIEAKTPLAEPLDVAPGRHVIEATLPWGIEAETVDAVAGAVVRVRFGHADGPPSATPAAAPAAPMVRLPVSDAVDSAPHKTEMAGPTDAVSNARVAAVIAIGGASALAVGLGAYFATRSRDDATTANGYLHTYGKSFCASGQGFAASDFCASWNSKVQNENREAALSTGLYVGAGVLLAGGLATWFLWPRNARRSVGAPWVTPELEVGGAGVRAGAAF